MIGILNLKGELNTLKDREIPKYKVHLEIGNICNVLREPCI